jgi:DNA repair protein SbcC/Rad50
MKTNVIQKNTDFRQCYELWILMDSIDQIGFDVDVYERDVKFDDKYIDQLYTSLLVLYSTVAYNQKEEFILNQDNPYEYRLIKRPKLSKVNPSDNKIQPGTIQIENNQLNQYYLEQIKKSNYARFKTLKEAGISIEESIEIVFKQIGQITNAVYEDYMNQNYVLENAKSLEEKVSIQEQVMDLYRKIEQIKREDMRSFTTQRAIALLQLRNLKDELKLKQEVEKEEALRLKEELRLEKEREAAQKAQERANRLKRIEREKALLEEARVKREEQKVIESEKKLSKKMAEKEKAKALAQKKREQDKLKKEKIKTLENEKIAKQKAKEKEKAKKLKEKELEKEKIAKQKQKDMEKMKKERAKEEERLKIQKANELEKQAILTLSDQLPKRKKRSLPTQDDLSGQ